MCIEPGVRFLDQLSVKTSFVYTRFVTSHEQDGLPLGIKGKSDSPHPVIGLKAKLLHVGVTRSVQGVHPWAAKCRSECLKKLRLREQLILHCGGQGIEFQDRRPDRIRLPSSCFKYDPKSICCQEHISRPALNRITAGCVRTTDSMI